MGGFDLERFKIMQRRDFGTALAEVRSGEKQSHWMWYIFPQLKGLGHSSTSWKYGIDGMEEAQAYMQDAYLRDNLLTISEAVLQVEGRTAFDIFGFPDVRKLQSCMTLFAHAAPEYPVFMQVIQKYYEGREDTGTLLRLGLWE